MIGRITLAEIFDRIMAHRNMVRRSGPQWPQQQGDVKPPHAPRMQPGGVQAVPGGGIAQASAPPPSVASAHVPFAWKTAQMSGGLTPQAPAPPPQPLIPPAPQPQWNWNPQNNYAAPDYAPLPSPVNWLNGNYGRTEKMPGGEF